MTDRLIAADPEAGDMLGYCLEYSREDPNLEELAALVLIDRLLTRGPGKESDSKTWTCLKPKPSRAGCGRLGVWRYWTYTDNRSIRTTSNYVLSSCALNNENPLVRLIARFVVTP